MAKRLIVIHTAECGEFAHADLGVRRVLERRHIPVAYVVGNNSHQYMIDPAAPCHAARGLPAGDGIHVEHVGFAGQTAEQWNDPYSQAVLARSAFLTADLARRFRIPPVHVTGRDVRSGTGFCGHIDVTNAYRVAGGHWDPGPHFPWDHYLGMVQAHLVAWGDQLAQHGPPVAQPSGPALAELLAAIAFCAHGTIRAGDNNDCVKILQTVLNVKTGSNLWIDGKYGPATAARVRDVQRITGLTVDGVCGPKTWTMLQHAP